MGDRTYAQTVAPRPAPTAWCCTCDDEIGGPLSHLRRHPDHYVVEAVGEFYVWRTGAERGPLIDGRGLVESLRAEADHMADHCSHPPCQHAEGLRLAIGRVQDLLAGVEHG